MKNELEFSEYVLKLMEKVSEKLNRKTDKKVVIVGPSGAVISHDALNKLIEDRDYVHGWKPYFITGNPLLVENQAGHPNLDTRFLLPIVPLLQERAANKNKDPYTKNKKWYHKFDKKY